jgi:acetyl/propionyl-CoA carboxylase alpha subunit
MRVVWKAEDMVTEIAAARRESRDSFGDDTLLLEVREREVEGRMKGGKREELKGERISCLRRG